MERIDPLHFTRQVLLFASGFPLAAQDLDLGFKLHHLGVVVGIGQQQVLQLLVEESDAVAAALFTEKGHCGIKALQLLFQ